MPWRDNQGEEDRSGVFAAVHQHEILWHVVNIMNSGGIPFPILDRNFNLNLLNK